MEGASPAVLLVTEDPALRRDLEEALDCRGLEARFAGNAREAFVALDRFSMIATAMVVIIDTQCLPTSGFELALEIRRQYLPDRIGLILLSDACWTPAQKAAVVRQAGLSDLLLKPVDPDRVAERALAARRILTTRSSPSTDEKPPTGSPRSAAATRAVSSEERVTQTPETEAQKTEAQKMGAPELRGNLAGMPFPRLLYGLHRDRATGALFLLQDTLKKIVYLNAGCPCYVKSNLTSECLGEILVVEKMISAAQCQTSLRRMKEGPKPQGAVLLEMGAISPRNLAVGLQLQLQTKLLELFSWSRGEFFFKTQVRPPEEVLQLDLSVASLVAQGIRRRFEPKRLAEALEPLLDHRLAPSPELALRFQDLHLLEEEQAFLDLVNRGVTLRELLSHTSLPRTKALSAAYILLTTEVITLIS